MSAYARQLVGSVTREMAPRPTDTMPVFWVFYSIVHWTHRSWWWCSRIDRYKEPVDLLEFAAGLTLEFTLGDAKAIQLLAKATEISLHAVKCLKAYSRIKENMENLSHLILGEEEIYVKADWRKDVNLIFISPSTYFFWSEQFSKAKMVALRVISLIVDIFRDTFLLSLHMMDACQAYNGHILQTVEFVKNADELLTLLSDSVKQNEEVVDRILSALRVKWRSKQFLEAASQLGKCQETVKSELKLQSEELIEILKTDLDYVRKGIIHVISSLNLQEKIPHDLVPMLNGYSVRPEGTTKPIYLKK